MDINVLIDNTQSVVVCDMITTHEYAVLLPDLLKFLIHKLFAAIKNWQGGKIKNKELNNRSKVLNFYSKFIFTMTKLYI